MCRRIFREQKCPSNSSRWEKSFELRIILSISQLNIWTHRGKLLCLWKHHLGQKSPFSSCPFTSTQKTIFVVRRGTLNALVSSISTMKEENIIFLKYAVKTLYWYHFRPFLKIPAHDMPPDYCAIRVPKASCCSRSLIGGAMLLGK